MRVLIKEKLSPHKSKTSEGYLICRDAILARTGKQTYYASEIYPNWADEDKEIEVMRNPEDVFSDETIASFENKPITCEHPDEDVTPENYKEYSVGFVRDVHKAKVGGEDVMVGNLIITDADIINDIENDIRTELSCGYNCDITDEPTPRQINIRGNHVALCEKGRAGVAKIIDSIHTRDKVIAKYTDPEIAPMVKVSKAKYHEITGTWPKTELDLTGPVLVETEKAYLVYLHPAQEFVHTGFGWQRTYDKEGWVPKSLAAVVEPASYFEGSSEDADIKDAKEKYIPGDVGFLKQIEDIAFNAKSEIENAEDREKAFFDVYTRLDNLIQNLSDAKKDLGITMANGIISRLKKLYNLKADGLNAFTVKDNDEKALLVGDLRLLSHILGKISGFTGNDIAVEDIIKTLEKQTGFKFIRESIDGWYKTGDGILRKDYVFKPEGYKNRILISLYAPKDYEVNEVNAYMLDSIGDKLIQSASKKALKKNIETEIKAGKDPKQAAAIAYSVQRANDSDEFNIKRVRNGILEIYNDGNFIGSADNFGEVEEIIKEFQKERADKALSKKEALDKIRDILSNDDEIFTDREGLQYLTVEATSQIKKIAKEAGLTMQDLENFSKYWFGPGKYSRILDSLRGEIVDTYCGYDINKEDNGYSVFFEDQSYYFEDEESAKKFIDIKLKKIQNMVRDYQIRKAISDSRYSPYFKKELEKKVDEEIENIKELEPGEEHSRLLFRQTKNKLLRLLKEQKENIEND